MNKQHQLNTAIASRSIKIAMLAMGIAVGAAGSAAAAGGTPAHPTVIKNCGTTITASGFYQVQSSLSAPSGGDCIDITASNVTLDIVNHNDLCNSTSITGDNLGSTYGIFIAKGATNTFIEGENSNIANFDVGIMDEGTGTTGEDFNTSNNTTAGIELDGSAALFTNFFSGTLTNLEDPPTDCFSSASAQDYGVYFPAPPAKSIGSQVSGGIVSGNLVGVFEQGAKGATVSYLLSGGNETFGYEFFEGGSNLIYDDLAGIDVQPDPPLAGNGSYGFNVDDTSGGDLITDNSGSGNGGYDIYAADNCSINTYWFNFPVKTNNACVEAK